jgi:hypothetical protein
MFEIKELGMYENENKVLVQIVYQSPINGLFLGVSNNFYGESVMKYMKDGTCLYENRGEKIVKFLGEMESK